MHPLAREGEKSGCRCTSFMADCSQPIGIMEIRLEIPETVAKTLGYAAEALPRRAWEALLVDECSRGHLTRGKVAELLGLSFHETENLFRNRRVPYPVKTHEDDLLDNAALPKSS
jgi:predicted HTH domain antitoxin